jgi:hypothetical protein
VPRHVDRARHTHHTHPFNAHSLPGLRFG